MASNIGLLVTYVLSILIMIGLPVALAFIVTRRFKVSWWAILTGVVVFAVSQMLQIPVLQGLAKLFQNGTLPVPAENWLPIFNSLLIGFTAALFQESMRYLGFWIMRKQTKRLPSAVGVGVGHGGFETLTLALWPFWPVFGGALYQLIQIVFYNPGVQLAKGIASDQVQYALAMISQFWTSPWHLGLLYGVDSIINISTQILLAILVWKAVRSHNFWWFVLAFFYHILVIGIKNFLQYNGWGSWAVEGILAIFLLANLYMIYFFWKEASDLRAEKLAAADSDSPESDEDEDEDDEDYEDDVDDDFDDDEDDEDDEEEVDPDTEK
jgi:uncharacterized membrane protein YhfC